MVNSHPHEIVWTTASPLWRALRARPQTGPLADAKSFDRPAILRFESDEFMEELFALVATASTPDNPSPLAAKVAVWRRFGDAPDGAPADYATNKPEGAALKLFQPVHGHFHLVVASLVCDRVGRPDHAAPPAQVGFVMRRLSVDSNKEYSWCPMTEEEKRASSAKPSDQQLGDEAGHVWRPAPKDGGLVDDEVVLPAFAVPFSDERGHPRRLWAALIPVSSPEARLFAKKTGDGPEMSRRFALRAVLTKPACPPAHRHVMSERTEAFAIASFVDPDAPARATLIALPKVPSVRSLLKRFPKKARFVPPTTVTMNDINTKKIDEIVGPEAGGMICSMSIPIITLCAYIVLSIVLTLLNYIFQWLPLVKICLPLPAQLAPEEE